MGLKHAKDQQPWRNQFTITNAIQVKVQSNHSQINDRHNTHLCFANGLPNDQLFDNRSKYAESYINASSLLFGNANDRYT